MHRACLADVIRLCDNYLSSTLDETILHIRLAEYIFMERFTGFLPKKRNPIEKWVAALKWENWQPTEIIRIFSNFTSCKEFLFCLFISILTCLSACKK